MRQAVHITLQIALCWTTSTHGTTCIATSSRTTSFVNAAGVAKLADLGLAKCVADASQLTGAKQGFGTPYYMPCEQAVDATKADARCDIYAPRAPPCTTWSPATRPSPAKRTSRLPGAKAGGQSTRRWVGTGPAAAALDPIIAKDARPATPTTAIPAPPDLIRGPGTARAWPDASP